MENALLMKNAGTKQAEEAELIRQMAAREEPALRQLIHRYDHRLRRFLDGHCTRPPIWLRPSYDEVVQDVFLEVWHGAGKYDNSRGSVSTWILAISRFKLFAAIRGLHKHAPSKSLLECDGAALDDHLTHLQDGPAEPNIDLDLLLLLMFVPSSLPANEWTVYEADLASDGNADLDELAVRTGRDKTALKNSRAKYRKKFRQFLDYLTNCSASGDQQASLL